MTRWSRRGHRLSAGQDLGGDEVGCGSAGEHAPPPTGQRDRLRLIARKEAGPSEPRPGPGQSSGAATVGSATISAYSYCTLRPRTDGQVTIKSLDYGYSVGFNVDDDLELDGQLDLPKATIARLRQYPGAVQATGFDLFIHTNAPPGSGLGSSSAVMVAVIGVVAQHLGVDLTEYEVAELAYRLEREDLQIEHQFHVLGEGIRNAGRRIGNLARLAAVVARLDGFDPALQFLNVIEIPIEPGAVRRAQLTPQRRDLAGDVIEDAATALAARTTIGRGRAGAEQHVESDARVANHRQRFVRRCPAQ